MSKPVTVQRITVVPSRRHGPAARALQGRGHHVETVGEPPRVDDYREGKRSLHLGDKRGSVMHPCASLHPDYICCNVQVLATVSNCPFDCSYCFLQNYLTDTTLGVVDDVEAVMAEVSQRIAAEPLRLFRVGTWELGDSLALEPLTGGAAVLVRRFALLQNAILELKTKSAQVDGLIDLPHRGRTVVSWTLNPQAVIDAEEYRTASLEERLRAMQAVVAAGYPVAVHFDPMICYADWRAGYDDLVRQLFDRVQARHMAWISIGSLRFNPEMKHSMEHNYPRSRATSAEMVLGDDGKMRYIKPLRREMYAVLLAALRAAGAGEVFTYLCMERPDMWEHIFGASPRSTRHLDFAMAQSLHRRFPGMPPQQPRAEHHDAAPDGPVEIEPSPAPSAAPGVSTDEG